MSEFHLGKAVQIALVQTDFKRADLCKALGISPQSLSLLCAKPHMSTKKMVDICEVLGITEAYLIGLARGEA